MEAKSTEVDLLAWKACRNFTSKNPQSCTRKKNNVFGWWKSQSCITFTKPFVIFPCKVNMQSIFFTEALKVVRAFFSMLSESGKTVCLSLSQYHPGVEWQPWDTRAMKDHGGPPVPLPTHKPHPHLAPPTYCTAYITWICGSISIASQLHRRAHQQIVEVAGLSCSGMGQYRILSAA